MKIIVGGEDRRSIEAETIKINILITCTLTSFVSHIYSHVYFYDLARYCEGNCRDKMYEETNYCLIFLIFMFSFLLFWTQTKLAKPDAY